MTLGSTNNFVEPGPSECCALSRRELLRDVESESSASRRRAVTLIGLDDLESAVLGGLLVHADGDLARTTAVDSTASELERKLGSGGNLGSLRDLVAAGLARVVRSIRLQGRVVKGVDVERRRGGHLHMRVREREEAEGENEAEVEKHVCGYGGEDGGGGFWNERSSGAGCRRTRPASRVFGVAVRCCVNVSDSCGL